MRENQIHVCFVIDESGSMYPSVGDVTGGYERIIKEQKEQKEGSCIVSLYRFNTSVKKDFLGKSVEEVKDVLDYTPGGGTALFDAVGTAIDDVGKWLNDMKEEDRPEKNLIVIMTDGEENSSREYSTEKVKDMIKHQEEKYNWNFMYLGVDLSNFHDANNLGIRMSSATSRRCLSKAYDMIDKGIKCYRMSTGTTDARSSMFENLLMADANDLLSEYKNQTGLDMTKNESSHS